MRLLLDAHVSAPRIARPLRERGHDVRAADEDPELAGAGDEQLLELASEEGRIMVTFDVADLPELARRWADEGRSHAGLAIVVGIDHREFGLIIEILEAALRERSRSEAWSNLTFFLDRRLTGG